MHPRRSRDQENRKIQECFPCDTTRAPASFRVIDTVSECRSAPHLPGICRRSPHGDDGGGDLDHGGETGVCFAGTHGDLGHFIPRNRIPEIEHQHALGPTRHIMNAEDAPGEIRQRYPEPAFFWPWMNCHISSIVTMRAGLAGLLYLLAKSPDPFENRISGNDGSFLPRFSKQIAASNRESYIVSKAVLFQARSRKLTMFGVSSRIFRASFAVVPNSGIYTFRSRTTSCSSPLRAASAITEIWFWTAFS